MRAALRGQAKALVSGVVAGLAFLLPGVDDGVSASEAIGATLAALTAWQAVYWTDNGGEDQ